MAQINKPNTYFNTKLYTGTGATQSITGVNFQPDLVWIKRRNTSGDHTLGDIVRGVDYSLFSNRTIAERYQDSGGYIGSLNTDGFTVETGSFDASNVNNNGDTYVGWSWKAGGTAVSNTDGSITSSVSANTTAGFSIVSYTGTASAGATVGHGLGVAPSVVLLKNRTGYDWQSYWSALGNTRSMVLNSTSTGNTGVGFWNNTNPSSSVVTLGNDGSHSGNCVMYCFAEKKGFSKFGSYVGNGSASNNTFVYTGFKPAFVLVKRTNGLGNWWLGDNKRNDVVGGNDIQRVLFPNLTNAEATDTNGYYDFFSNGFRVLSSSSELGGSGDTYIYMAFAENPLVGTNNIPTTAR